MSETIKKMIYRSIENNVVLFASGEPEEWNLKGLRDQYLNWLTTEDDLNYSVRELDEIDTQDIIDNLYQKAIAIYNRNVEQYGEEIMDDVERNILLRTVDRNWMEHIDAMEDLKDTIRLQSYAQRDPAVEYRLQGADMFDAMVEDIRDKTSRMILSVTIKTPEVKRVQLAKPLAEGFDDGNGGKTKRVTVARKSSEVGRNDLCPCGSGKKYKKCCGAANRD